MCNTNNNKKSHKRKAGRQVTEFKIQNKTYSVRLTNHAETRLKERKIDLFQTVGAILSLGENRILDYSGSNKDIFIMDKENNFSIVCNIELRTITIVTVIHSCDCWIKSGTIAVNL